MRKIIVGLLIAVIPSPAFAECTTGNCGADINCTTGEVTYYDVPVNDTPPAPQPVAPTHQVIIQTSNFSMGIEGTLENVTSELNRIAVLPEPLGEDPCASGGCMKTIVNATTGEVQVLPLDAQELAQRAIDRQNQYQQQLDLALLAQKALIEPISIGSTIPIVGTVQESVFSVGATPMALTMAKSKIIKAKVKKVKKIKKRKAKK